MSDDDELLFAFDQDNDYLLEKMAKQEKRGLKVGRKANANLFYGYRFYCSDVSAEYNPRIMPEPEDDPRIFYKEIIDRLGFSDLIEFFIHEISDDDEDWCIAAKGSHFHTDWNDQIGFVIPNISFKQIPALNKFIEEIGAHKDVTGVVSWHLAAGFS